jgi:ribosomal protein L37AE/L43A
MDPLLLITTTLNSIKTALDIIKVIDSSDNQLDTSILKMRLVEITESLVDTKGNVIELKEELQNKQNEIESLKKQIEDKDSYKFNKYYYFRVLNNDEIEGPYCPTCFEKDHKPIHLIQDADEIWKCNICKIEIKDDKYKEEVERIRNVMRQRNANRQLPYGF